MQKSQREAITELREELRGLIDSASDEQKRALADTAASIRSEMAQMEKALNTKNDSHELFRRKIEGDIASLREDLLRHKDESAETTKRLTRIEYQTPAEIAAAEAEEKFDRRPDPTVIKINATREFSVAEAQPSILKLLLETPDALDADKFIFAQSAAPTKYSTITIRGSSWSGC